MHNKYGACYIITPIKILHKGSQSSGGLHSPIAVYYTSRNWIYLIRKHYRGIQSTIKIIVNIFVVESIKRLIQFTLVRPDLKMLVYHCMGLRDAARGKYGRREDLHVEYLKKNANKRLERDKRIRTPL